MDQETEWINGESEAQMKTIRLSWSEMHLFSSNQLIYDYIYGCKKRRAQ